MIKQTKIIATISALNCGRNFIRALHDEGVDVVRLNTAHQSLAEAAEVIKSVRAVSARIAILLDTKGPEIRTSICEGKINLAKNDLVKISGANNPPQSDRDLIWVNYKNFVKEIPVKARILIDDGDVELIVEKKTDKYLSCRIVDGGQLGSRKGVNVPGVSLNLPSLSAKDKQFIKFAVENDLDFIAHSFVRNSADVMAVQKILNRASSPIKIIAKIENQLGIDNIDEILDHCYGVMVARGDMGIEIPAEEVPMIQKSLVRQCIARRKPVIIATQMLHSMINNPRPTRAEVSDVANAVLDGADAIMLSGETAGGKYPLEAVKIMTKIAARAERNKKLSKEVMARPSNQIADYLAKSAILAIDELDIKEIIISTNSNYSARVLAAYRPKVPIFVKCFDPRRVRQLALLYGVRAHFLNEKNYQSDLLPKVLRDLVKKGSRQSSDLVIFLNSDVDGNGSANTMEICEVGKYVK